MNNASIRPSLFGFMIEAPQFAYAIAKKSFLSKFSTPAKKPDIEKVKLQIVDECLFPGSASIKCKGEDLITVVYDKESLDSLYGLSFFMFLYGNRVQPVAYQNVTTNKKEILHSKETIVLGVDLPLDELLRYDGLTDNLRVFSYRGTFDYLYETALHDKFRNVTLYMPDFEYNIGFKGAEQLENSIAMMLKIMYFDSPDFAKWPQHSYAKAVAHANSMYVLVPEYKMTKSVLELKKAFQGDKEIKKARVHNNTGALMMDFRHKLEEAANHSVTIRTMWSLKPEINVTNYTVRRKRMADHILKTGVIQMWKRRKGGAIACNTVPVFGPDVVDMVDLSTVNNESIVCVEDAGMFNNYYVYAKEIGRAMEIADAIKGGGWFRSAAPGETSWRRGSLICVSKRKEKHAQR